ncbi:hypothetical protein M0802_005785 [Mischocyttarus mexicanus]|nr:hypothetical protein M0802_005785 [Mischocyttarus mexicanus]
MSEKENPSPGSRTGRHGRIVVEQEGSRCGLGWSESVVSCCQSASSVARLVQDEEDVVVLLEEEAIGGYMGGRLVALSAKGKEINKTVGEKKDDLRVAPVSRRRCRIGRGEGGREGIGCGRRIKEEEEEEGSNESRYCRQEVPQE